MLIGKRLRESRIKKGYSQEQLGDLVGISKVSICGYEQENRVPTLFTFLTLAKVLDADIDYLLGEDIPAVVSDEDEEEIKVKIRREDLYLLEQIKLNKQLYDALIEEPTRTLKLINKKLYE